MWDLVGNPEDRFSHNEAQMGVDEMGSRRSGNKPILNVPHYECLSFVFQNRSDTSQSV